MLKLENDAKKDEIKRFQDLLYEEQNKKTNEKKDFEKIKWQE